MRVLQVTSAHSRDDIRIYQKISRSLNLNFRVSLLVADGLNDEITTEGIKIFSIRKPKSRLFRFKSALRSFRSYSKCVCQTRVIISEHAELLFKESQS